MAAYTSMLAWEITRTEEPGGLHFTGSGLDTNEEEPGGLHFTGSGLDTNEHTHSSRFFFFSEEFRAKHFLNISSNTHY